MKRLVLLGGGHAHVQVLAGLGRSPLAGWQVDLVTPQPRLVYSGMLAGWMAGHYDLAACTLPVGAPAHAAGATLRLARAIALDLDRNEVRCDDGGTLGFDLVSIDTGPEPAIASLPGADEHAVAVRPLEAFVQAWPALLERMQASLRPFDLVVVGGGAAGVELAFAMRHKLGSALLDRVRITVVGDDRLPVPGAPERARHRLARWLAERRIHFLGGRRATRIRADAVELDDATSIACDACVLATGAAAPTWPAAAGLATDRDGYVRVDATLRSVSHPAVFAAGNVAEYHVERPRSGVYAVRAGPVLLANLRAAAAGRRLRTWHPQQHALYILGTGGKHALAWRGRWSIAGRWVWHWKDRIDRRFVNSFSGES
ncbi:MAG: FAD-dependent oxidoreductase [Burkholderiales bacterium]